MAFLIMSRVPMISRSIAGSTPLRECVCVFGRWVSGCVAGTRELRAHACKHVYQPTHPCAHRAGRRWRRLERRSSAGGPPRRRPVPACGQGGRVREYPSTTHDQTRSGIPSLWPTHRHRPERRAGLLPRVRDEAQPLHGLALALVEAAVCLLVGEFYADCVKTNTGWINLWRTGSLAELTWA